MKINKILPLEHKYLQIVGNIAKQPQALYCIGTLPFERRPTLAVVGTRKPTPYGKEITEKLAYELASKGIVIVSGLALGVDALAHRAALDAGGTTIAVVANALPDISPRTNRDLARRILSGGGAILSEHIEDDEPYAVGRWSFLERNRIVAGISDAVLITEANARSGSLNTAMYALEQGKEVFVVPGNITSPLSAGCNALLKQGAIPVTCAEDVLNIIAPDQLIAQPRLALGDDAIQQQIIELISAGVRDGDEIRANTEAEPSEFSIALTTLELQGTIRGLGANQWTLR